MLEPYRAWMKLSLHLYSRSEKMLEWLVIQRHTPPTLHTHTPHTNTPAQDIYEHIVIQNSFINNEGSITSLVLSSRNESWVFKMVLFMASMFLLVLALWECIILCCNTIMFTSLHKIFKVTFPFYKYKNVAIYLHMHSVASRLYSPFGMQTTLVHHFLPILLL